MQYHKGAKYLFIEAFGKIQSYTQLNYIFDKHTELFGVLGTGNPHV